MDRDERHDAHPSVIPATVPVTPACEAWAGVVVRPPSVAWDGKGYVGASLVSIDETALDAIPTEARVIRYANFVGVVAPERRLAEDAARRLNVQWTTEESVAHRNIAVSALAPKLHDDPPVRMTGALAGQIVRQTYRWNAGADLTGAAAPAAALAIWNTSGLEVWTNSGQHSTLRADLAAFFSIAAGKVRIRSNGMSPSSAARDTAADAALLARLTGVPVSVHYAGTTSRYVVTDQIEIEAQLKASDDLRITGYESVATALPGRAPPSAAILTGVTDQLDWGQALAPSYTFPQTHDIAEGTQVFVSVADEIRGTGHVFARESLLDEFAVKAGLDPVEFRLGHIADADSALLVREVARRADWLPSRSGHSPNGRGRGFAYATTIDEGVDPPMRSSSAWVADVTVDPEDGRVHISRLVVGHNLGDITQPRGSTRELENEVRDAARRVLPSPSSFDDWGPGTNLAANEKAISLLQVDLVMASSESALKGAPTSIAEFGAALEQPAAAAVANAIYDATGVRLREPPFGGAALRSKTPRDDPSKSGIWRAFGAVAGLAAVAVGLATTALPWRAALAPIARPDLSIYSASAIERGRLIAMAGDCAVCHTASGGVTNAGGLPLETPFGTIYSTNITPDPDTGIGNWSYPAFERAMRHGIHRDGRHLYPAFPYTAFAKITDTDLEALYAYLMSQPAVRSVPKLTKLAFPFNLRPLMAGWNALFHDSSVFQPQVDKSAQWNRGAYLVEGVGHCGACHTPRNVAGAEQAGAKAFLGGGEAEGWTAPALNALSRSPQPWTEEDLYQYLRTGFSPNHGVAAGPMAPVVHGLAALPDSDVRSIAVYLASLKSDAPTSTARITLETAKNSPQATQSTTVPAAKSLATVAEPGQQFRVGERIFNGACAVCHGEERGPKLFGVKPPLGLNSNLHADTPDNLIQVILHGIREPAHESLGYMPGFGDAFNDEQIAQLVAYLRARYAVDKAAWPELAQRVRELRRESEVTFEH